LQKFKTFAVFFLDFCRSRAAMFPFLMLYKVQGLPVFYLPIYHCAVRGFRIVSTLVFLYKLW